MSLAQNGVTSSLVFPFFLFLSSLFILFSRLFNAVADRYLFAFRGAHHTKLPGYRARRISQRTTRGWTDRGSTLRKPLRPTDDARFRSSAHGDSNRDNRIHDHALASCRGIILGFRSIEKMREKEKKRKKKRYNIIVRFNRSSSSFYYYYYSRLDDTKESTRAGIR